MGAKGKGREKRGKNYRQPGVLHFSGKDVQKKGNGSEDTKPDGGKNGDVAEEKGLRHKKRDLYITSI